ncbi:SanA/YdcF family protein [Nocardia bovistercoris]|uniref:YdcF family protein n=1 Tax=Nocardia bovistercoris TaxID=2785916 RepID=A0A931IH63_9NOCA|nr:YdcF family protein [Nocardia bovistercoris]
MPSGRLVLRVGAATALIACLVAGAAIGWVRYSASGHEYSADAVPAADVAIVFGAQIYADGTPSPYVQARLQIGQRLLESGRVRALLLTGDNGTPHYDEPTAMRDYLIRRGVPAEKIALDYAGFDTYQSCTRAKRIFGVERAVVVNQDFSMARTIALCRSVGVDAVGVADHGQPHNGVYWKCWIRDQLAATKAAVAMITRPDPTFLGDQETSVRDAIAADPR